MARALDKVFAINFARLYPMYVQKAERKKRTKEEVDKVICWLTGYTAGQLRQQIERGVDLKTFFAKAPAINPDSANITGVVCGVRVETIEDPLMRKIRYLDKLVDELAQGKALEKILQRAPAEAASKQSTAKTSAGKAKAKKPLTTKSSAARLQRGGKKKSTSKKKAG